MKEHRRIIRAVMKCYSSPSASASDALVAYRYLRLVESTGESVNPGTLDYLVQEIRRAVRARHTL